MELSNLPIPKTGEVPGTELLKQKELPSIQSPIYGDTIPNPGTPGTIFKSAKGFAAIVCLVVVFVVAVSSLLQENKLTDKIAAPKRANTDDLIFFISFI